MAWLPKAPAVLAAAALLCDPSLTRLFTPRHPQLGHYEVCVDARPLAEVAAARAQDGFHDSGIDELEALDAFGSAGSYDRAALARLYGGRRVKVVRGWKEADGRFESDTLLSPHPDAALKTLEPGTLMIRWITSAP